MVKRTLRFTPEFLEDIMKFAQDPGWREGTQSGRLKVVIDVDHPDGYNQRFPIKVFLDPLDFCFSVEWEIPDVEDVFERLVFRELRTE